MRALQSKKATVMLGRIHHIMTEDNQATLELFCRAREKTPFPRVLGILRSGIYRQTFFGNLGLIIATLVRKV
jgi:hypothetical protein